MHYPSYFWAVTGDISNEVAQTMLVICSLLDRWVFDGSGHSETTNDVLTVKKSNIRLSPPECTDKHPQMCTSQRRRCKNASHLKMREIKQVYKVISIIWVIWKHKLSTGKHYIWALKSQSLCCSHYVLSLILINLTIKFCLEKRDFHYFSSFQNIVTSTVNIAHSSEKQTYSWHLARMSESHHHPPGYEDALLWSCQFGLGCYIRPSLSTNIC